MMKSRSTICSRFAVLFAMQLYGHMPAVLTVAGAYNNKHPDTQLSSRVDRAGLISAAPW